MSKKLHKNETGIASLVIAILIVVVITTIVLGFMQIIRREQRRTLDNQLSTQAQYAAESGVNDAQKAILTQGYTGTKSTCAPLASGPGVPAAISGTTNKLSPDGSGNVQYTCLLINPSPDTLEFDNIRTDTSTTFPIETSDGTAINSFTFAWQDTDATAASVYKGAPNKVNDFVPQATWGKANGMLRIQLVPLTGGNILRSDLVNNSKTVFVYPSNTGGVPAVDFAAASNGDIIKADCANANTPKHCKITFNNVGSTNLFYARVTAIYRPSELSMSMTNASGTISFKDAQTLVDSTGRASDVVRRIQVRVPSIGDTYTPEDALRSIDSLCKKFSVFATAPGVQSDDGTDPACNPNP